LDQAFNLFASTGILARMPSFRRKCSRLSHQLSGLLIARSTSLLTY
jgi:hypothetical protein